MNEQELVRKLNSVGKSAFVNYFQTFKKYSEEQISKTACIDSLVKNKVSNSAGAAIRAGNARQIFQAGMERQALEIVVSATRVDSAIIMAARNLLN